MNCTGNIMKGRLMANFFPAGIRAVLLAIFIFFPARGRTAKLKSYADVSPKTTISVSQMAEKYCFRSLRVSGKRITMLTRFNTILLEGESRKASFNGVNIWLNGPITRKRGSWHIQQADIDRTFWPLLNPDKALAPEDATIVVLDPGHGGKDQGTCSRSGLTEKKLNLDMARKVRAILLKYRIDTRLTRNSDQYLELDDRTDRARWWKSSLFISIHFNAAESSGSSGVETFILPPAGYTATAKTSLGVYDQVSYQANQHDRANMLLGYLLQKSLVKHTRAEDRGVRRARFMVLKNIHCPAALIEGGFLSNRAEAEKLANPAYLDTLARGIAEGILAYVNSVKRANQAKP